MKKYDEAVFTRGLQQEMLEAGELSAQEYQLYMLNSRIDRKTFLLKQMQVVDRMNHGDDQEHEGLQKALASKLGSMAALQSQDTPLPFDSTALIQDSEIMAIQDVDRKMTEMSIVERASEQRQSSMGAQDADAVRPSALYVSPDETAHNRSRSPVVDNDNASVPSKESMQRLEPTGMHRDSKDRIQRSSLRNLEPRQQSSLKKLVVNLNNAHLSMADLKGIPESVTQTNKGSKAQLSSLLPDTAVPTAQALRRHGSDQDKVSKAMAETLTQNAFVEGLVQTE
jgi:hypothetical protein